MSCQQWPILRISLNVVHRGYLPILLFQKKEKKKRLYVSFMLPQSLSSVVKALFKKVIRLFKKGRFLCCIINIGKYRTM